MSRSRIPGRRSASVFTVLCLSLWPASAWSDHDPELEPPPKEPEAERAQPTDDAEELVVTGQRQSRGNLVLVDPAVATPTAADTTALMLHAPGADVVDNGPLSGQVQYRGLFGPRVNVVMDGMALSAGGPNWMDPPLHYAPRSLLESLELERGIASVSSGLETIGGTVQARMRRSRFTDSSEFEIQSQADSGFRTVDESYSGGGLVAFANDTFRGHFLGSADIGNDYDSPTGEIHNTGYERWTVGGGTGVRLGDHQLGVDYRHSRTDDTGTPALPMDIDFFNTELASADYEGQVGQVTLRSRFSYQDVDHAMNNFELRQEPADPTRFRFVNAASESFGWAASGAVPLFGGRLEVGVDGHVADHDMNIFDPNNDAFFVRNFNDVMRDRYGVYTEWRGHLFEVIGVELGARYTRVQMDAGQVDSAPSQTLPPPMMLRDEFNAANRDQDDDNFDWVVKLGWSPTDTLRFELEGARKTRSPYYVERYAWLPLEVSAGLADGRNYVGTINLDPEVSHEVGGGFDLRWGPIYVSPRAFFRYVEDYIQGLPSEDPRVIAVSTLNGDPNPLVFSNVDAKLYGIDTEYVVSLPFGFQLDGTLSYVRGERDDVDDDLYRISPLHGRTTLSYRAERWSVAVEGVYAAAQNDVSATNGESSTSGWGVMNLYANWSPWDRILLTMGITNVTDNGVRQHLAGINRVANSGVPLGVRIPDPGINFFGRASVRW